MDDSAPPPTPPRSPADHVLFAFGAVGGRATGREANTRRSTRKELLSVAPTALLSVVPTALLSVVPTALLSDCAHRRVELALIILRGVYGR